MRYYSSITTYLAAATALMLLLSGCYTDKSTRNIEFAPNMYNSLPLEPYSQTVLDEDSGKVTVFANGLSAQNAPAGTVPRKSWYNNEVYKPYLAENNEDAYRASDAVMSPISDASYNAAGKNCTEASFQRGERLYGIYCTACHGDNGNGKGSLYQGGALRNGTASLVPAYSDRPYLTAGKIYHVVTYGRGLMGGYASQLTPEERWEVTCYVQKFLPAQQASADSPQ